MPADLTTVQLESQVAGKSRVSGRVWKRRLNQKEILEKLSEQGYFSRMPKRPSKSNSGPENAKNANPRGDRLTSKHGKSTSHQAPARRMAGGARGR